MKDHITIGLAGDVMIGRNVDLVMTRKGYAYPWGNVLPLFKSIDVNIVNLETTLTRSNHLVNKVFNFRATPDKVNSLCEAHITAVNLANNHILDYSEEGLKETIHALQAAHIQFTGAGLNRSEAAEPVIINRNNLCIGLAGFTDNEPAWEALHNRYGTNYINIANKVHRSRALKIISRLRKQTDLVVVSIHWGPNKNERPAPSFIQFAHDMVNSGAHIIHGHSAHNFQGIELYKSSLILYDTGDFIDDYVVDPYLRNDHSFLFIVQARHTGVTGLQLLPVLINKCQVNIADGSDFRWAIHRIRQLSYEFGTRINDEGVVRMTGEYIAPG